jgi:hypothetical protein
MFHIPKNPVALTSWMVGNLSFAFFVFWTATSFFPGTEWTPGAMLVEFGVTALSIVIGLYLMHINND